MFKKGQGFISTIFILILVAVTLYVLYSIWNPFSGLKAGGVIASWFAKWSADNVNILFIGVLIIAGSALLILFGVILAGSYLKTGRIVAYVGVAAFIIGLFAMEFAFVLTAEKNTPNQMTMMITCLAPGNPMVGSGSEIADQILCAISGHKFAGQTKAYDVIGFWIFGVLAPMILLYYIFEEFVTASQIIQNQTAQRMIALAFALLAFRGFIVAKLIEVISLGTVGIALIAIDLLFAGGLFGFIGRAFKSWQGVEDAMDITRADSKIKQQMIGLVNAGLTASRNKDQPGLNLVLNEMAALCSSRPHWEEEYQQIVANKDNFPEAQRHLNNLKNRILNG